MGAQTQVYYASKLLSIHMLNLTLNYKQQETHFHFHVIKAQKLGTIVFSSRLMKSEYITKSKQVQMLTCQWRLKQSLGVREAGAVIPWLDKNDRLSVHLCHRQTF